MESGTVGLALALAFAAVALVYAAVGQAGGSGYMAAMALAGLAAPAMKTTALALNIVVALIGTAMFLRAGRLDWRGFWPFAVTGVPASWLGGAVHLPEAVYFPLVGAVLVLSAVQMARSAWRPGPAAPVPAHAAPPLGPALLAGGIIGLVSGTTGTGGGVFLAPVLLALHWSSARQAAATTAAFNLVNSAAALIGARALWGEIPAALPVWLGAVGLGGLAGAWVGSRRLSERALRAVLAVLLLAAGIKLIW